MSGGRFDYDQYRIGRIIDDIEDVIRKNKVEKAKDELERWDYDEDGNVYEDCKYHYWYDDKTIERFNEAVRVLRQAEVYAQRIDWLLSGGDGEESFHSRLEEELKELEGEQ